MVARVKRLIVMTDEFRRGITRTWCLCLLCVHWSFIYCLLRFNTGFCWQPGPRVPGAQKPWKSWKGREWEQAQLGVFRLWNAKLSCAAPGPSSGLGWGQGRGRGRVVLLWGGTDSWVALGCLAKTLPFDWEVGSHPVRLRNVTGVWITFLKIFYQYL